MKKSFGSLEKARENFKSSWKFSLFFCVFIYLEKKGMKERIDFMSEKAK